MALKVGTAVLDPCFHVGLEPIRSLSDPPALLGFEVPKTPQHLRKRTLFPQQRGAHRLERGEVRGARDRLPRTALQRFQFLDRVPHPEIPAA